VEEASTHNSAKTHDGTVSYRRSMAVGLYLYL